MTAIPCVGKVFATTDELLSYLAGVTFGAWRPRFVTMHHTGAPNLATWNKWQARGSPSDEQWMKNLARYYGDDMGWRSGPHFFFTPKHYCVLSPPGARGVHAVSFNATSWGVECVGDFDTEPFDGAVRDRYVEGLAALHVAAGLAPQPYERGARGLHFHRDDPKTTKTCPGNRVQKIFMVNAVEAAMARLTPGDHPDEKVVESPQSSAAGAAAPARTVVATVDDLNVRAAASGKAPAMATVDKGARLTVHEQVTNTGTVWLRVTEERKAPAVTGWVAARFTSPA